MRRFLRVFVVSFLVACSGGKPDNSVGPITGTDESLLCGEPVSLAKLAQTALPQNLELIFQNANREAYLDSVYIHAMSPTIINSSINGEVVQWYTTYRAIIVPDNTGTTLHSFSPIGGDLFDWNGRVDILDFFLC
jgi:hypothetical protein